MLAAPSLKWSSQLLLFVIFITGSISSILGQSFNFRNYTSNEGLSQMNVLALLQDRDGYIWIGTEAGLNFYNGEKFKIYSINDGLENDYIRAIIQDGSGKILIGSRNGLFIFQNGIFSNYSTADGLINNNILCLATIREGKFWCGTNQGLSCRDGSKFTNYTQLANKPITQIRTLLLDHFQKLWIGTDEGLFSLAGNQFNYFAAKQLSGKAIFAIAEDSSNSLWVGTNDALFKIRDSRLISAFTGDERLSNLQVKSICAGKDGSIWIGGSKGLLLLQGNQFQNISDSHGNDFHEITSIIEDHEGIIWIGHAGGVSKFIGRAFIKYTVNDGLGSDNIRPILRDRHKTLWAGGLGGLHKLYGGKWQKINAGALAGKRIYSLFEDSRGILWIGTFSGLIYYDGEKFHEIQYFKDSYIPSIIENKEGLIYVAGTQSKEGIYKGGLQGFEPVKIPDQILSNSRLLADSKGNIWIAGDMGLTKKSGNSWKTFTTADGLASNDLYFLCEDKEGTIWFGYHSSHGLTSYNGQEFKTYSTKDGLNNNSVYSIGVDNYNNLWIGTARGVDKFDGQIFINYGTAEGYASNESNSGGFYCDTDGTLWFGTAEGLSHYFPQYDLALKDPPPIKIHSLLLGEIPVTGERIKVPYFRNDFSAGISCLSYINERRISLQYILSGYDNQWKSLERGNAVIYTNLPPGMYTLKVRGRKYQYNWSEPVRVSFTITPPFWQTWWFIGLSALFIGAMAVGIVQMRIRRLVHAKNELEQIVAERTKELEKLSIVARETDNAVIIMDEKANIEWINQGFTRLYGLTLEELFQKNGNNLITASLNPDIKHVIEKCMIDKISVSYESIFETKLGQKICAQTTLTPILDDKGNVKKLITIDSDITGRKIAEENIKTLLAEKELILKEVHHRIKNNMATVIGLFSLQAGTLKNPDAIAALQDAGSRVQSMEVLYDKLYQSIGSDEVAARNYLPSLVDEIVANFPDSVKVKVVTNIADFVLNARKLQPLGIIINELLTNIMKYAFAGRSDGLITVSAELQGNRVSLAIQDNGIGMPETVNFENSTGFGLRLVSMLTKQLAGTIRIEHGNGTMVILEFEK